MLRLEDYLCQSCGDVSRDTFVETPIPKTLTCDECGGDMIRLAGCPAFKMGNAPMTEAKDIWEGFDGLEDTDGINQTQYQSTKAFFG